MKDEQGGIMSDICMCSNIKCNKRDTCYRAQAKPNPHYQTYSEFPGGKDCEYYWRMKEKDDTVQAPE